MNRSRRITVLLFDGFELLDVFGPVEVFHHAEGVEVEFVAVNGPGLVASSQGVQVRAEVSCQRCGRDVLLVPGGPATRSLAQDSGFLDRLAREAQRFRTVASVCTGSALLAAAGLLEEHRATSNKRAFGWASSFGREVAWQPKARWVRDRERWSSSGVTAGMDMAAAMVADWQGREAARAVAQAIELEIRADSEDDPFAVEPRA